MKTVCALLADVFYASHGLLLDYDLARRNEAHGDSSYLTRGTFTQM